MESSAGVLLTDSGGGGRRGKSSGCFSGSLRPWLHAVLFERILHSFRHLLCPSVCQALSWVLHINTFSPQHSVASTAAIPVSQMRTLAHRGATEALPEARQAGHSPARPVFSAARRGCLPVASSGKALYLSHFQASVCTVLDSLCLSCSSKL